MHNISKTALEEIEFHIKKKGLWEVVIADNISYRDIFDIIKALHEKNTRLTFNLEILRNELRHKNELLKLINSIGFNKYFINKATHKKYAAKEKTCKNLY